MAIYSEADSWSDENREKAVNNVYHSVDLIESILDGSWTGDLSESPEKREEQKLSTLEGNVKFLEGAINHPYYESFLDKQRVQACIDSAK